MIGKRHRTLERPASLSGVGVHSGTSSTLRVLPDPTGDGIRFRRIDLPDSPEIPATLDHVVNTDLGTTIAVSDEARVMTVEHVMAALTSLGVTRATIEIDGQEPPILDGSFLQYMTAFAEAGVQELADEVPVIRPSAPITHEGERGSKYLVVPSEGFRISATIDFPHPRIGRQYGAFDFREGDFATEIAPARTFGFESEAESLRSRGLALGTSLDNTVVLNETDILNPELRFPDEFLRHKVGDMVGDLALLGARLEAHIVADRSSHRGNVALGRAIQKESRRSPKGRPILDVQQIIEYLPHRYPMLLVDRITDFEAGKRIVGIKNVTINEPFFQGHYPGHPIMPGVLIVEAMAQVGGLLLMDSVPNPESKVVYFMSLDNVKWRRPVTPGDQLVFELELLQLRRSICKMRGEAYVDGQLVAEAELMASIVDK